MRRRFTVSVFVLVLAVTLAGCNAVLPQGTATSPPSPTPASETPSATPAGADQPAGLTADGVTDPYLFASTHESAVAGRSVTLRRVTTVRTLDGTEYGTEVQVVRQDADRRALIYRLRREGTVPTASLPGDGPDENPRPSPATIRIYLNDSVTLYALSGPNGTQYSRQPVSRATGTEIVTGNRLLLRVFLSVDTAVTDLSVRNGTTVYRVESTAGPHDLGGEDVTDVDVVATVQADGLVRTFRVSLTNTNGDQPLRVTHRFRYTAVGTTAVTRPPWADAVVANTTPTGQ